MTQFKAAVSERARFVPFLGAGLSVSAGIPAIGALQQYLAHCIELALFPSSAGSYAIPSSPLFGKGRWPAVVCRSDAIDNLKAQLFKALDSTRDSDATGTQSRVLGAALGALQDWRDSLDFLSRLQRPSRESQAASDRGFTTLTLGPPDGTVRDSFFQHVVSGHEPALGHRMLVALTPLVRTEVILTTNFDSLLEIAFEHAGLPLQIFDVHLSARLPSPHLTLRNRALIKIHGGRYGVRADYSLDSPASEEDRWAFISYLVGEEVPPPAIGAAARSTLHIGNPCSLLVAGYSGQDARSISLFKHALTVLQDRLRVFWVCHTKTDEERVKRFLKTSLARHQKQIFTTVDDFGLLALDLYQEMTQSIPSSGVFFPTTWNLPFPARIPSSTAKLDNFGKVKEHVESDIQHQLAQKPLDREIVELRCDLDSYGAHTLCYELFGKFSETSSCIWIDLDDIPGPRELFLHLVGVIARRTGTEDPLPLWPKDLAFKDGSAREFAEQVIQQILSSRPLADRNWLVFLNGRENPGENVFPGTVDDRRPSKSGWHEDGAKAMFFETLAELARQSRLRFVFVVIVIAGGPLDRGAAGSGVIQLSRSVVGFSPSDVVAAVSKWLATRTDEAQARAILLYVLLAFNLTRHPAAIYRIIQHCLDRDMLGEGLPHRFSRDPFDDWIANSLTGLAEARVFRYKPGGFIWMDFRVRQDLRVYLDKWIIDDRRLFTREDWNGVQHRVHRLIARWYGRLFIASADPLAAFAVVYHAVRGIAIWSMSARSRDVEVDREMVVVMLRHARLVLATAEDQMKRRLTEHLTDDYLTYLCGEVARLLEKGAIQAEDVKWELAGLRRDLIRVALSVCHVEGNLGRIREIHNDLRAPTHDERALANSTPLSDEIWLVREAELQSAFANLRDRKYPDARQQLLGLANNFALPVKFATEPVTDLPRTLRDTVRAARKWLLGERQHEDAVRFVIKLIRRLVYLCMHEGQAQYLAETRRLRPRVFGDDANPRLEGKLQEALVWCECGMELLRGYPGRDDDFVYHENARYRAHLGLIQGRRASMLDKIARGQGFLRAESILADADAYLVEFPLGSDTLSRAIVLLRRAELRFLRVRTDPAENARNPFQAVREILAEQQGDARQALERLRARADVPGRLIDDHLRLLEDAFDCIEQAERFLSEHRKNVWWLHLAFVLRVLGCECYHLLNWLRPRNEPSVPQKLEQLVGEFLTEQIAAVPSFYAANDSFFLARVIEALLNMRELSSMFPRAASTCRPEVLDRLKRKLSACLADEGSHAGIAPTVLEYASSVNARNTGQ